MDAGVEGVIVVARRANQLTEGVGGCASLEDDHTYSTGRFALARGGFKVNRSEGPARIAIEPECVIHR